MLRSLPPLSAIRNPLLAAALCLAFHAGVSPAQQTGYPVRGTVLDSVTKQPIARALVQVYSRAMLTDADGAFEFTGVQAQQASILVRRPGYVISEGSGSTGDQDSAFLVNLSSAMAPLQLFLTPEAVLTGQISSANLEPAAGVQVTAYRKGVANGRPGWKFAGGAVTNSRGTFRLASLHAGAYLLYAQSVASPDSASSRNASVYFPGVVNVSEAGIVTVAPGEHKEADMTMQRQTLYPVNISVANVGPGAFVSLELHDAGGLMNAGLEYNQQKQAAHADLPSGRYVLNARSFTPGVSNQSQSLGRAEFAVSGRATYLTVSILPIRSIPVILRKEFTAPETGGALVMTHLRAGNYGLNLTFVPADSEFSNSIFGNAVESLNNGLSYQIEGIPPGRYWVSAPYVSEGYISSITSGGNDLSRDPFTVGAGGASPPIEITQRNDTGSLAGTLSNSPTSASGWRIAQIYAIPLFSTISELPSITADSAGKFLFDHLAPGSYRVVACDSPQEIDFHTPDGIAAWAGKGQVVTVEPGGTAHVQLDLTSAPEPTQ